jgi:serine/threonine protein kinase
LPPPPLLNARAELDGYRIVRELHASHRSHLYLALDGDGGAPVVLKTPSIDRQGDPDHLERLMMEEWVARRVDSPHVLKARSPTRERRHLYVVFEHVEGQTLRQWMVDHPRPALDEVRAIVEQIARGLQAFHRLDMLHQDLRPENVMIDRSGTVKLVDFGAVRVAGVAEMAPRAEAGEPILGTTQYSAPELFLGEPASERSDLFSLAVITYEMLSGRLPYGMAVANARTRSAQRALRYEPVLDDRRAIPRWIDAVLRKALQPDPLKRHEALSEFVHELRQPNPGLLALTRPALLERHPLLFWQTVSALLAGVVLVLLFWRLG